CSPDGKEGQEEAEGAEHHFPGTENIPEAAQVQFTDHHHNNADARLNSRTEFYADIIAIVESPHQHQHTRTGEVKCSMRNVIIRNAKGETDTCVNRDAPDQRDQSLMAFTKIR